MASRSSAHHKDGVADAHKPPTASEHQEVGERRELLLVLAGGLGRVDDELDREGHDDDEQIGEVQRVAQEDAPLDGQQEEHLDEEEAEDED